MSDGWADVTAVKDSRTVDGRMGAPGEAPSSTVVLGVGSPLMGDDGLGVSVVDELRAARPDDPGVAVLDGGTWGMQILPFIEEAERLLIIDAVKVGAEPGSLIRLEGDEVPRHLRQKLSPHQIELGEVLAVAQLRGLLPAELVALGIEPARIELHEGLSDPVRRRVPELLAAVEEQLAAWGHSPREALADA